MTLATERAPRAARPALRYHGGKWRLAPWIVSHFPAHVCYVEPFGGGASVLLSKAPAAYEVYNDREEEVVAFFRVLRDRPEALVRAIEWTPYARRELQIACEEPGHGDDLERARRLYVRSWQKRSGVTRRDVGSWRFQRRDNGYSVVEKWDETSPLFLLARRLKAVQIECDDWAAVLARYDEPTTLFYVDPPYVPETRSRRSLRGSYVCDMDNAAHRDLLARLGTLRGMTIVSGYEHPLYAEALAGWGQVRRRTQDDANRSVTECLWLSPSCRGRQLDLFEERP